MKLYVVRHGETAENALGILCGQGIDTPLTEKGIAQAQATAKRLMQYSFDSIYSSTLVRARQSAQILAQNSHSIVKYDDRLKERDYGSLYGKTWVENFGNEADRYRKIDIEQQYDYHAYGGESAQDVWARLSSFLDDLRKSQDQIVLIVTHGGVLKALKKHLSGTAYEDAPKNASVHEFDI